MPSGGAADPMTRASGRPRGANPKNVLSVNVSVGVSERKSAQNPSDTLRDAGKALYRAKEARPNPVS